MIGWQTFGRFRFPFIQSVQCSVTSQAALVNIQRVGNDCARPEVTGDGLDTAEVWGSSPDAPTIPNNLTPLVHFPLRQITAIKNSRVITSDFTLRRPNP
jgi:hypothetical protein